MLASRRRTATLGVTLAAATLAALAGPAVTSAASAASAAVVGPRSIGNGPLAHDLTGPPYAAPPTIAQCRATRHDRACYGPNQLTRAYNVDGLHRQGITGKGVTIAIVDPFGTPTGLADLQHFDRAYGLPDPPSFKVIAPAGKPPAFDPDNDDMVGSAEETTLDIQTAHTMAPGANILLVETPVSETEGVHGFPEIVKAENYVIDHGLADIITQSFGASERTFPSKQSLLNLRSAFVNAQRHGVTVLASSGDSGPTDVLPNGNYAKQRTASWPTSDPLVTSVGGTELHLNQYGGRYAPDSVWDQTAYYQDAVAGGGTTSMFFPRPAYQNSVKGVVGAHRGLPDVSLSASTNGGAVLYSSFYKGTAEDGFYVFGGTSESSPMFSGIVALAVQAAGHRLGLLNPTLYKLGTGAALPDVTHGNNTVTFTDPKTNKPVTVQGYAAVKGYDLASGLGTIDGVKFVQAFK